MPVTIPTVEATHTASVPTTPTSPISELRALQLVNLLVKMEISTQVGGRNPTLVAGDRLCWSVPVWFTLPGLGMVGQAGVILVDANTGEVLVDSKSLGDITANVKRRVSHADFLNAWLPNACTVVIVRPRR